jgi:putative phosphoribosyl transferase
LSLEAALTSRDVQMNHLFRDRREAGRRLGDLFARRTDLREPVVLALPRGGVPVGFEIARALRAPLDVLIVRKLGFPGQPELAMGAIASGGVGVMNPDMVSAAPVPDAELDAVVLQETRELERREKAYRGARPRIDVRGRTVVLADDGVATGSSMLAAIRALRVAGPESVVAAIPVAPQDALTRLEREADEVVCLASPEPFYAISVWYESFPQLDDSEVRDILDRRAAEIAEAKSAASS